MRLPIALASVGPCACASLWTREGECSSSAHNAQSSQSRLLTGSGSLIVEDFGMVGAWSRRLVVLLLIGVGMVSLPHGTVRACSCAGGTPEQLLMDADASFIGSLAAVDPDGNDATYSFDVEFWLNGDLDSATVDVESAAGGASCGFELSDGQRAAVFLRREGDRLTGGLCSTLNADVMLAALDPAPLPGGAAAFAVPGTFAAGRFAMLDADGALVGYTGVQEEAPPRIFRCPGDERVVTFGFPMIEVLDLVSFEVVRSVDTGGLQQSGSIDDLRCVDPAGTDVRLLVDDAVGETQDVRSLDEWSQPGRVLSRRPGARTVLVGDGLVAVEPQDPGDLLVAIDLDGTRRVLGEIERPAGSNFAGYESIVADPTGTRIAVSEVTYLSSGVDGRLVVIDSASGAEVVATDIGGGLFVVAWLDDDRLIMMRSDVEPPDLQIRDADTLEVLAELPGWPVFGATVVGDDAWGMSQGAVVRGSFATGVIDTVEVLPSEATGEIIALDGPVDIEPASAETQAVVPREPRAITADETKARRSIESTSAGRSRVALALVGLAAIAVVGTGVAFSRKRKPNRPPETAGPTS